MATLTSVVAATAVLVGACGGPDTTPTPVMARDAGFRATFPGRPAHRVQPADAVTGAVAVISYLSDVPDGAVGISSSPVGPAVGGPALTGSTLRGALGDAIAGSAQNTGGRVTTQRILTWQGRPAEDAVISTSAAVIHERVTVAGGRLYVLEGITRGTAAQAPAGYALILGSFRVG